MFDFRRRERPEFYRRDRQPRRHARGICQRHCGQHLMLPRRQLREHGNSVTRIVGFAEYGAVEYHGRISGQHRQCGKSMRRNGAPARRGFFPRHPQNIILSGFTGPRRFIDVSRALRQLGIVEARLDEQFAPARTAGSEIKAVTRHHCSELRTRGLAMEAQSGSILTPRSSVLFTMVRMPGKQ